MAWISMTMIPENSQKLRLTLRNPQDNGIGKPVLILVTFKLLALTLV